MQMSAIGPVISAGRKLVVNDYLKNKLKQIKYERIYCAYSLYKTSDVRRSLIGLSPDTVLL